MKRCRKYVPMGNAGFQLWVNLPASAKNVSALAIRIFLHQEIPELKKADDGRNNSSHRRAGRRDLQGPVTRYCRRTRHI